VIHLIIGNTGAGKTTYAQKLKQSNQAVLFSVDKWNKELFLPDRTVSSDVNWFIERINRSEVIISDLIVQLHFANCDAILDLGFAKVEHRKKFIDFCKANSLPYKLHYLDIPTETRWQRVTNRNTTKGSTFEFEVTRENFDFMESWFEPLTESELEDNTVSISKL